jgi:hypothetical protein
MTDVQTPVRLEFFYGKPTEDPFQWLESFELFIEINQVVGDRVLRFVKHAMREEAYTWFRANQDDFNDWDECKEAFLERFGLDEDTLMLKLDTCAQQSNETVRSYADRYRKLVGYMQNSLPPRMVTQLFVKGLVPHLRERVQMTYPGNGALGDIIRLAASYEQTFGHEPIGAVYSNQNTEVPVRERIEQWNRHADDNVDQRAARTPLQQNQRENNRDNQDNRNWPRQRDFPERRNQQQPAARPRQIAPINPPREAHVPPHVTDIDTLTREMEKLRIQLAELQRPQPAANYTNFVEHGQSPLQQPTPQHATMMFDELDDPFWPAYATKRPAETQSEADPPPLRRRPNNLENTTVDPTNVSRPAAPRPFPVQRQPAEPPTPAAPPPAPAREPAARSPVDLGGLPPLPNAARPAAYRRPIAAAPATAEPVQQIKGLPMKLTVQTYLNHVSEAEFNKSIEELRESREQFLRNKQQVPPHVRATNVEVIYVQDGSTSTSGTNVNGSSPIHVPQSNLQRNPVNTTVATVPIIINGSVFEEGIIDTGATNTMISQTAARQLNLIDQIEPSRLRYSCADGKMSSPWGIIRKLLVGVEGLVIPIDVFVSGATSYDVLLGTDWLTQAHAEISFAKQEMSFRIEPHILGRVPITVMPASKSTNRYCITRVPEFDFGGPAEHLADPGVPVVPALPEVINIVNITSEEEEDPAASQHEVTSTDISDSTEEEHHEEYDIPMPTEESAAVESEVVNARLPTQPRDEYSPDSLQRTVYNMQKPHFVNNSLKSFSTPASTCPRIANTDLCSTIDSDCFGPTFLSARVICPSVEYSVHFKVSPPDSTWSARPSLGWTHKCCSVLPRVSEMSTRLKEMIRTGIVLHALKRFKVAYTTTGRMLKVATSLRRKTMNEKKLASKDLSQSSTSMECRSLELDGIRKQRAAQPCASILLDHGSPINDGDAASAVPFESPPQRAALDNETYNVPCSKDEVQGAMQGTMSKDQACRKPPAHSESFYYHGYINKEYATPRRIRASI